MYGCDCWTINKAEYWKIDAFELLCWRRLCGVAELDCKEIQPVHPKGNQPWIFIGRTDVEAEDPILWPPWCEELTHLRRPWCWERLKAGGEGNDRGWDGWMASPTQRTWIWVNSGNWWGQEGLACCSPSGHKQSGMAERLKWIELREISLLPYGGSHVTNFLSLS